MKRLTFSILTLLIALQSGAQDWREMRRQEFSLNFPYKYEVRIGWSGYPILEAANFPNYGNLPFMDYDMIHITSILPLKACMVHIRVVNI